MATHLGLAHNLALRSDPCHEAEFLAFRLLIIRVLYANVGVRCLRWVQNVLQLLKSPRSRLGDDELI